MVALRAYALVSQSYQHMEIYRRADASWEVVELVPDDPARLSSLDFTLSFEEIYDGAEVPREASSPD